MAVDALGQIVFIHIFRLKLPYSIVAGILCGLAVVTAATLVGIGAVHPDYMGLADIWCVAILTYLALAFGFWAFLNLNITSMRIRVLRAMLRAGGGIELDNLRKYYGQAERLNRRLERLRKAGQIRLLADNRWRLSSWEVLQISRCIDALRQLIVPAEDDRR